MGGVLVGCFIVQNFYCILFYFNLIFCIDCVILTPENLKEVLKLKAKIFGDSLTAKFAVNVSVRCAGGYFAESQIYYVSSLLDAFQIEQNLIHFQAFFAKKSAKSSRYLFGGGFHRNSDEWIVCHTFNISIYDLETDEKVSDDTLIHPYLERICERFN